MYEKQFLREMVKAMRSATTASGFMKPTMAEGLYKEQLDEQYVDAWGDKGGLGFHQIIHDQLMGMLSPADASRARARGPIPLTDRDVLRSGRTAAPSEGASALRIDLAAAKPGAPASRLASALDGEVASIAQADGRTAIAIRGGEMGELSRSTYVFEGAPRPGLREGAKISAGDPIGVLSADARSFFVNLQARAASLAAPAEQGTGP